MVRLLATAVWIGALLVGTGAGRAAQENPVSIVSIALGPNLQTETKEGVYSTLIEGLLSELTRPARYTVLPLKRAIHRFATGEADCIWGLDSGVLVAFGVEGDQLLQSDPVFLSSQHVFTASPGPVISSTEGLRGRIIGASLGTAGTIIEKRLLAAGARVVFLPTQSSKAFVLVQHHVDAIIGWLPDLLIVFEKEGYPRPQFDPQFKLMSSEISVVCHATLRLSEFIREMNSTIRAAQRAGTVQSLIQQYQE